MTLAIHITEQGRVWPTEEVAALGEVFTTDAPLEDLQRALEARGYLVFSVAGLGRAVTADVMHELPAVTGENVTDEQIRDMRHETFAAYQAGRDARRQMQVETAALYAGGGVIGPDGYHATRITQAEARARCAAAINARRGAQ